MSQCDIPVSWASEDIREGFLTVRLTRAEARATYQAALAYINGHPDESLVGRLRLHCVVAKCAEAWDR